MQRRRFVAAGSLALLTSGLALWGRARGSSRPGPLERGQLVADPRGVLDLAPGFRYRILERAGQPMDDGYRVPARPDAMACFRSGQRIVLMRNHELDGDDADRSAYAPGRPVPAEAYDAASFGGVSRVVLDAHGQRLSSNLVLAGTSRNCAGGVSPWGFLSCEESVLEGHGYVFLCSLEADRVRPARRITAYGRFLHEAVAIDPRDHAAYLTEDRRDGCLYRFVPKDPQDPFGSGRFQALRVLGTAGFELARGLSAGETLEIGWVTLTPEAHARDDELRHAAQAQGAAVVRRGEGIWLGSDGIYFTSTTGGPRGSGQIFRLVPSGGGGTLTLVAQAEDEQGFDMPDNLTIMPSGDLLVCEDNSREAFLQIVTRRGRVIPFARNAASRSELAGICFSPDGNLAFVNIQEDGLTLVIEGPFHSLASAS